VVEKGLIADNYHAVATNPGTRGSACSVCCIKNVFATENPVLVTRGQLLDVLPRYGKRASSSFPAQLSFEFLLRLVEPNATMRHFMWQHLPVDFPKPLCADMAVCLWAKLSPHRERRTVSFG